MRRKLAMMAFALGALSVAVGPVLGDAVPEAEAPAEGVTETVAPGPARVTGPVYLVTIHGDIELGLAAYVRRTIEEAKAAGAGAVVLDINTPGGRVDAALDIKDILLDSPVKTVAIVNRQAFSAGALIALAAEDVYVVPGASIGAATPVMGTSGEQASEKMVSALRTAFAATAEQRGRDAVIAKAMVDDEIAIDGLIEAGKLLTMTHDEAIARGIADGTVGSLDALLGALASQPEAVIRSDLSLAERLVRFLTNPVVAALLMSLGFLGMFFELQSPGWGLGGTIAVVCLGLYFWGHHLAGLAGFESAILIGIGIVLMVIEVFLIPGFGIFGLLGLASFLGGLFLSRVSQHGLPGEVTYAFYVVCASFFMMLAGAWAMLTYLPRNKYFAGLVLFSSATSHDEPGEQVPPPWGKEGASFRGRRGVALTDLRPSGTMRIDGAPVDVVTEGAYIEAGSTVEIISDNGSRRVVRAIEDAGEGDSPAQA
jgi:membrane-bound serine protease (ClpP class)